MILFAHSGSSEARAPLPIPLWMLTWGAAAALVISFVALAVLWARPKLAKASDGKAVFSIPDAGQRSILFFTKTLGLLLYAVTLYSAFFGNPEELATPDFETPIENYTPILIFMVFWVGALLVNGIFGNIWRLFDPIATLSQLISKIRTPLFKAPPQWVNGLPAAGGLAVFLFLELIFPYNGQPRALSWFLLSHLVISLLLTVMFGADWLRKNEPFAALFTLLASMGIFYFKDNALRIRPPLSGLISKPFTIGSVAIALVVLGGTSFDGFGESELATDWLNGGQSQGMIVQAAPDPWAHVPTKIAMLIGSIVFVSLLYFAASLWAEEVEDKPIGSLAKKFGASLIPIVFGYSIAHYFLTLIEDSQAFYRKFAYPLSNQWQLYEAPDSIWRIDITVVSWIQACAIILGHIGAVIITHDQGLDVSSKKTLIKSQSGMLLVMVFYSCIGLWLLNLEKV